MRRLVRACSAIVAAFLIGCSGDGAVDTVTPTGPPGPAATYTVEVTPAAANVAVGDAVALTATVRASSGTPTQLPTWTSSNPSIATVSGTSSAVNVTALALGEVIITATAHGVSASTRLTVVGIGASFTDNPVRVFTDSALVPAPAVTVTCGSGVSCSPQVRLEIAEGPAGATLTGTLVTAAVNGVARFPDVRVNESGTLRLRAVVAAGAGDTATSAPIDVQPSPVLLDSVATRLISTPAQFAEGTLTYLATTAMPTLKPGAVITGPDRGGYLRRVTSVNQSGATVTATTEPAALTDAVREAVVSSTTTMLPSAMSVGYGLDGTVQWGKASVSSMDDGLVDDGNGRLTFTRDRVLWGSADEGLVLRSGGYIQFAPTVTFGFQIDEWEVSELTLSATGAAELNAPLWFGIKREASAAIPPLRVATFSRPFVLLAGSVPVYGRVDMVYTLVPAAAGKAEISVQTLATASGNITVGARYEGGAWQPQNNAALSFAFTPPETTVEAEVQVSLGLQVELRVVLYQTLGPYVAVTPYVQASLAQDAVRNTLVTSCSSGLNVRLGFAARILTYTLLDYSAAWNFLESEFAACRREIEFFPNYRIDLIEGGVQTGTVNTVLPNPLVVRVRGPNGLPANEIPVRFSVIAGRGGVSGARVQTDANGRAAVMWTLGDSLGLQQAMASLPGAAGSPVVFLARTIQEGRLEGRVVDDSSGVGIPLADVRFRCDTLTFLPSLTDESGSFTSTQLPAGTCSLTVDRAGYERAEREAVQVVPNITSNIGVIRLRRPTGTLRGSVRSATSSAPLVGATVELFAGLVTSGSPVATRSTDANGAFRFGDLTAGTYSLRAKASGHADGESIGIEVPAGDSVTRQLDLQRAGTRLVFLVSPSTGTSFGLLNPAVQVAVQDDRGETVAGADNAVTLFLSGTPEGVLSGTSSRTAVNGAATFGDLRIGPVGCYTLTATSPGLEGASSNTISIGGGCSQGALTGTVRNATTQAVLPGATVELFAGATLGGAPIATRITDGSGGYRFDPLEAGIYSLRVRSNGFSDGQVLNISVGALTETSRTISLQSAPTHLAFLVVPASGTPNGTLSPSVQVAVRNVNGTTVAGATNSVTLSLSGSPSGTLSGTRVRTAVNGIATFSDLRIDPAGCYTILATSPGLEGATSTEISIGGGCSQGSLSGVVRNATTQAVISGATVELFAGATISGSPIATRTSTGGGEFRFDQLAAGTYSLRVRASGFTNGQAQNITVTAMTETTRIISMPVVGTIALALDPPVVVLRPGEIYRGTATLTRTDFTGSVTLSRLTPLPAGLNIGFGFMGTNSRATLNFSLASSHESFTSVTVTIRASGSGVASVDQTVQIVFAPDSTAIYEAAVIGTRWLVERIGGQDRAEWRLFSESAGGGRRAKYYGPPSPTDGCIGTHEPMEDGMCVWLARWGIARQDGRYILWDDGFWHSAFSGQRREPLTIPPTPFVTFSNFGGAPSRRFTPM